MKRIHYYTRLFARCNGLTGRFDQVMDSSSLLMLGILIEEMAKADVARSKGNFMLVREEKEPEDE